MNEASTTQLAAAITISEGATSASGQVEETSGRGQPRSEQQQQTNENIQFRVIELYEQLYGPMSAYLRTLGLFDSDADDVIQETFLRLMTHLIAVRPEDNLRAWLFQVAYNKAMDVHRLDTRWFSFPEECDETRTRLKEFWDTSPAPDQIVIENERLQRVRVALGHLPIQQRQCVVLRSEGLRYREIASSMGVSTQRVSALMGRGISRLLALL